MAKLLLLPLVPALAFSIVEVANRPAAAPTITPTQVKLVVAPTSVPPPASEWCGTKLEVKPPVSLLEVAGHAQQS